MLHLRATLRGSAVAVPFAFVLVSEPIAGQLAPPPSLRADSVIVVAGTRYQAGAFRRFFLGNTFRDLWATPFQAEVFKMGTVEGGLRAVKLGGSGQTKSLRLEAPDGREFVFRNVDKDKLWTPERYQGTIVESIFRDQVSGMHPSGAVIACPILDAAGVLHPDPGLAVMPDEPRLGEFRQHFVGRLGLFEAYPNVPKNGPAFEGAADVEDSDDLFEKMNEDPKHVVDARALLTARLTDMFLNDADRHADNWKWARFKGKDDGPFVSWVPIARDRDHVFSHYDGVIVRAASMAVPNLFTFGPKYPSVAGLSSNARQLDRRFLVAIEKPIWDSITTALMARITDAVIDSAVRSMPAAYHATAPELAATLKARRNALPGVSNEFYHVIAKFSDVHASDADDRLTVTRLNGGEVEIRLESGDRPPYFVRRFVPTETREIRVYLHGGDDRAVVRGDVDSSIPVWIVGGNGSNVLTDSSTVGGRRDQARLYDQGTTSGVTYKEGHLFEGLLDRRPWVQGPDSLESPARDHGARIKPIVDLGGGSGLGLVPQLGVHRYTYGFGRTPYASMVGVEAEYSGRIDGWRVTALTDIRRIRSSLHFGATARMSDFEVINFHGLGNQSEGDPEESFEVRQRQWMAHPTIAYAFGRTRGDFAIGPVVQYSVADSSGGRYISETQPYGFGKFGQVGARATMRYDSRKTPDITRSGVRAEASGSFFPAAWDVTEAFSDVAASASTYLSIPILTRPVFAVRAGGRRVFGDFPFHEAAFLGGRKTIRAFDAQRYAGDASVYGSAELRVPIARVKLILPFDIGLFGFADAGRVYVDGDSPGGWHSAAGGGIWIGIIGPSTGVSVTMTNRSDRRILIGKGLTF